MASSCLQETDGSEVTVLSEITQTQTHILVFFFLICNIEKNRKGDEAKKRNTRKLEGQWI